MFITRWRKKNHFLVKKLIWHCSVEYFQSLPEDDETRKLVDGALETLQNDDDRDVRYFSGGKVEDRLLLNETTEVDHNQTYSHGGIRIIQRDIHEYTLNDDENYDDEDNEFVEEVYIADQPSDGTTENIVVEEYYIEKETPKGDEKADGDSGQVYVEEIIEEIIETVGDNSEESS